MKKYIAAIDLGTTKVVAIVGEKLPSGKIHVLAHCEMPSKGVVRGEVLKIDEVVSIAKSAVEEVKSATGLDFSDVYVGVAGQHIRCIESRFDIPRDDYYETISAAEIRKLKDNMYHIRVNPDEEVLHVIPQSYNVDDWLGLIEPVGMLGRRLEANFKVFVGRMSSAERTRLAVERMGLQLNRIVLEPIASARAVLHDDEQEMGVALVDIGGGTTDLIVYYDKIVRHTAVIPFGGNVITDDIREGCAILPRQAEQLKVQYGSCYSDLVGDDKIIVIPNRYGDPHEVSLKMLAQIIEARMEEIMEAVVFEIERSGYADRLSAGIVITGGGANIGYLPEYIKYKTGLNVRRGKPLYVSSDSSEDVVRCSYATAVGLLMKGFDYEEEKEREAQNKIQEIVPEPEPVLVEVNTPANGLFANIFGAINGRNREQKQPQQENIEPTKSENPVSAIPKSIKPPKPPKPPKVDKPKKQSMQELTLFGKLDNEV